MFCTPSIRQMRSTNGGRHVKNHQNETVPMSVRTLLHFDAGVLALSAVEASSTFRGTEQAPKARIVALMHQSSVTGGGRSECRRPSKTPPFQTFNACGDGPGDVRPAAGATGSPNRGMPCWGARRPSWIKNRLFSAMRVSSFALSPAVDSMIINIKTQAETYNLNRNRNPHNNILALSVHVQQR